MAKEREEKTSEEIPLLALSKYGKSIRFDINTVIWKVYCLIPKPKIILRCSIDPVGL